MTDYGEFLRAKVANAKTFGFEVDPAELNPALTDLTRAMVRWALAGGRRGLFAKFGLHKTCAQIEIMRVIGLRHCGIRLIALPLGVRGEFMNDAAKYFTGAYAVKLKFIRRIDEIEGDDTIYLTNYESVREGILDIGAIASLVAVSLDEAAILRGFGGTKTFREAMAVFAGDDRRNKAERVRTDGVPFRFVATATPDPNEHIELLDAISSRVGTGADGPEMRKWADLTTGVADTRVMLLASRGNDSATTAWFGVPSGGNLVGVAEHIECGTDAGNGGGFVVASGTKAAAGAIGIYSTTLSSPGPTETAMVAVSFMPGSSTTVVSADATGSYTVTGTVQADGTGSYAVLSTVQADGAASYAVVSAVQADKAASYAVVSAVQASATASYGVGGSVQSDGAASYAVITSVQSSASASYGLLAAVQGSAAASYTVVAAVQSDAVGSYSVLTDGGTTAVFADASVGFSPPDDDDSHEPAAEDMELFEIAIALVSSGALELH